MTLSTGRTSIRRPLLLCELRHIHDPGGDLHPAPNPCLQRADGVSGVLPVLRRPRRHLAMEPSLVQLDTGNSTVDVQGQSA